MKEIDFNFLMFIILVLSALSISLFVMFLSVSRDLKIAKAELEAKQEIRSYTKITDRVYSSILEAICGEYGLSTYALVSLEYIYHVGEQPQIKFTKSK